ncbi:AraC family transcriptional regulator [Nocardia rhizosphaerae]|uniref:AraC family transcriptional regulator n=1 Tax=Nocardia rhizosphaerae TaxID=1691571 RepID=A0ABV8L1K2_9NOCA
MNPDEVVIGGPEISTAEVSQGEAFDLWASIMSESVLPCSMEPRGDGPFYGSLTPKVMSEPLSIALAANSAEIARRTKRHIASASAPYALAGLTISGVSELACDGEFLRTPAGSMFLVDGEHPQEARTSVYRGLLIRVPKDVLLRSSGLGPAEFPATMVIDPVAHGALVIDFFRRFAALPPATRGVGQLLDAGVELLGAALAIGSGESPARPSAQVLDREQVARFLRSNLADPDLSAQRIAEACGMSRRKLFRAVGPEEGGPMALLRGLRVERARTLLTDAPDRTIASIARACGFASDRHFYRVFRGETGMTPADFRECALSMRRFADPAAG